MPQYDYIFTGTGAAALSLLARMVESGKFNDKKILLIDRSDKTQNDRTWCYWEKGKGYFENLVFKQWDQLSFHCKEYNKDLDNQPYQYKMIRGIDFYTHCLEKINASPNIERVFGEIEWEEKSGLEASLLVDKKRINTDKAIVFNSIYKGPTLKDKDIHFLQHFKGWIIETDQSIFDPSKAILMDFRVHQQYGASFVYVLPLSGKKALVEYTLFTPALITQEQYNFELKSYIAQYLQISSYSVQEEEFGVIPMTTFPFSFVGNGYFNIGTAGGQTKASTGYTFQFIQKQAALIFQQLLSGEPLQNMIQPAGRFHYYDKVLLRVLSKGKLRGDEVFARLFNRNRAASIFKFLDNETSLSEEIRIMSTLQFAPFLQAGWRALF